MGKVKCNYLFQLKAAAYLEHHPELDCLLGRVCAAVARQDSSIQLSWREMTYKTHLMRSQEYGTVL